MNESAVNARTKSPSPPSSFALISKCYIDMSNGTGQIDKTIVFSIKEWEMIFPGSMYSSSPRHCMLENLKAPLKQIQTTTGTPSQMSGSGGGVGGSVRVAGKFLEITVSLCDFLISRVENCMGRE